MVDSKAVRNWIPAVKSDKSVIKGKAHCHKPSYFIIPKEQSQGMGDTINKTYASHLVQK